MAQKAHERNEEAAKQIEILAGLGLPQADIRYAVEAMFSDQGYSEDTLTRHYREELDRGMAKAKTLLLQKASDRAHGRNLPEGVSPDVAYREQGRSLEWMLNAVHKIIPHSHQRHSGPDGGAIPIANIDLSSLTDDDLAALERISEKLHAGSDQGRAGSQGEAQG